MKKIIATFQLSNFIRQNRGLKCRMKCGNCNKAWSETATQEVHMTETPIEKNGKIVAVISYICQTCANKILEHENKIESNPRHIP